MGGDSGGRSPRMGKGPKVPPHPPTELPWPGRLERQHQGSLHGLHPEPGLPPGGGGGSPGTLGHMSVLPSQRWRGGRDAAKHPAVHRRPHHRPCPDPTCREAEPSRFGGDSGRGPRPRDARAPGAGRPRGACPAHMEQTSLMKLLLLKALTHAPRGPTDPGGGCDLHGQGGRAGGGGGWVGR